MLSTNVQKPLWNATWMSTRPQVDPRRFPDSEIDSGKGTRLYIWNSGWMMICCGSRLPAVNSTRKKMLNFQLYRLAANATIDEKNSVSTSAGARIRNVFQYFWRMSPWSQALR